MSWPKSDSDHLMVTSTQMGSIEAEILSSGLPLPAFMEKVGISIASWLLKRPDLIERGVLIMVGPGHNGGDGLVVARELHLSGIKVFIWCPLPLKKSLTEKHLLHAKWLGIKQLDNSPEPSSEFLWIDALFGLGQSRPLPEFIANLFESREKLQPGKLISLDIPAGICSDSGKVLPGGGAIASYTLTVGFIKQGLVQDIAINNVGRLVRIDLGFTNLIYKHLDKSQVRRICSKDLSNYLFPSPDLKAMKYERGRLLVIAGSNQYLGASLLSLQGALASGAGSIKAVVPKQVANNLWQVAPEIVLVGVLDELTSDGENMGKLLSDISLERFDALLIGPGLGNSGRSWIDIAGFLERFQGLLVLDADGINLLAATSEGWQWLKRRVSPTWITPHRQEFERLFPKLVHLSPLKAAREAAKLSGTSVLLKGAHSIIADPAGDIWQLGETAPWVARSGLGDVLGGFVAGLGAIGIAVDNCAKGELLAASTLMHSEAAINCVTGSSASSIASSLAALTRSFQSQKFCFEKHNGLS